MICRFRDCSKQVSALDDLCGANFCGPEHRSAERTARQDDDDVAVRAEALAVIRNISSAHLVGEQARIISLAFKDDGLLRHRICS